MTCFNHNCDKMEPALITIVTRTWKAKQSARNSDDLATLHRVYCHQIWSLWSHVWQVKTVKEIVKKSKGRQSNDHQTCERLSSGNEITIFPSFFSSQPARTFPARLAFNLLCQCTRAVALKVHRRYICICTLNCALDESTDLALWGLNIQIKHEMW